LASQYNVVFSNKLWAKTPMALVLKIFKSAKFVLIEKQGFNFTKIGNSNDGNALKLTN